MGEAIKIYKTNYDIKIVEIIWDYAKAMLRVWYGVIWDYAETMVWCYWLYQVMIVLGNKDNGLGKIKIVMGRN